MSTRRRPYRPYDYEAAITDRLETLGDQALEDLLHGQRRYTYAAKRIIAGSQMEVEVYPEFTKLPVNIKREKDRAAARTLITRYIHLKTDEKIQFAPERIKTGVPVLE